jgi:hypothetical protein
LSSSSPSAGVRIDCDLARGDRCRLFEALAGLIRLLRRRRWPEGATESISMSSGSRPAPADWGAADTCWRVSAPLVAAVACPDADGADE